jgi:hypothetical protein
MPSATCGQTGFKHEETGSLKKAQFGLEKVAVWGGFGVPVFAWGVAGACRDTARGPPKGLRGSGAGRPHLAARDAEENRPPAAVAGAPEVVQRQRCLHHVLTRAGGGAWQVVTSSIEASERQSLLATNKAVA